MRKMVVLIVATTMVLALTACGTPTKKHTYRAIKCPACGYQFDAPAE